jgi:organic radical activating enzyme
MPNQLIDKQIHANELKLRLLMTNYCNRNCSFCLNDFQLKPELVGEVKYLDQNIAKIAIKQYADSFKDKYPLQVYFSGGEPTLHPNLTELMKLAKSLDCRVTLITNGDFPDSLESELRASSDEIHFGTYEKNQEHAEKVKRMEGLIQGVYPNADVSFIEFYSSQDIPIKIFRNFYDSSSSDGYENFSKEMKERFPKANLSFRHTGIQENRGPGCDECKKTCVTLKAAWIFPDGGSSPCPQLHKSSLSYPKTSEEWSEYFMGVEQFHKKEKK